MELTAQNVEATMHKVLFASKEEAESNPDRQVRIEGIAHVYGFDAAKLESVREDVLSMLLQLPNEFLSQADGGGGGWSFLNACVTRDDRQWGEHMQMEVLVCLGIALGYVSFPLPRELWTSLPGSVPYFEIHKTPDA